mgnify:CR=1 FL=1
MRFSKGFKPHTSRMMERMTLTRLEVRCNNHKKIITPTMQTRDVKVVILSPPSQNRSKSPGPNTYSNTKAIRRTDYSPRHGGTA